MNNAAKKLIIALDDLSLDEALRVVEKTKAFAETYKIGLSLFCAYGPSIIREIKALGVEIFLDLKLHDIPMQVAKAVESALKFEPKFLTLHALGGRAMLQAATKVAQGTTTKLLAVSVLTSMDLPEWQNLGFSESIDKSVNRLLDLSFESGVRGFVSSPHEAAALKLRFLEDAVLVCPGIRSNSGAPDDQKRIMSAFQAIEEGADYLVVGRPITKSEDLAMSAKNINQEITEALSVK